MKKVFYILTILSLFFVNSSCEDEYREDEPLILTTRNSTMDVLTRPLSDNLGQVLGFSTAGPVSFSLVDQTIVGAVRIGSNGDILVADPSSFDLTVNPTMQLQVLISKDGKKETSFITLNLKFRETDGDGVFDFQEIENGTDLNDPCDPAQDRGYTGFNKDNRIWAAANCDGDGLINADDNEPYNACEDNVNTSIWTGNLALEDVGFDNFIRPSTNSCRAISIKGDLISFFGGDCDDAEDIVAITFEPEFEGATNGSAIIPDQLYLDVCSGGFGDRIRSVESGTYDEETQEITIGYVIYFDEFDPALVDTDYFAGTLIIKPE